MMHKKVIVFVQFYEIGIAIAHMENLYNIREMGIGSLDGHMLYIIGIV